VNCRADDTIFAPIIYVTLFLFSYSILVLSYLDSDSQTFPDSSLDTEIEARAGTKEIKRLHNFHQANLSSATLFPLPSILSPSPPLFFSAAMSEMTPVTKQPSPVPKPEVQDYSLDDGEEHKPHIPANATFLQRMKFKYTTKEGLLGNYDWGELCMPRLLPYKRKGSKPAASAPFYALEDNLPVLLAATCGLQHCLAMLAGLSE
jgi:hypothetical protein